MDQDAWNEAVIEVERLERGFTFGSMTQSELVPPLSKLLKRCGLMLRAENINVILAKQAESLSEQLFAVRDHVLKWNVIEEAFDVLTQIRSEVFLQRFPRPVGGEGVTHPTEIPSPAGLSAQEPIFPLDA